MNEYIFYTTEGFTVAPNQNVEIDNCQILGFVNATSLSEAKRLLVKDNPWISAAGFTMDKIMAKQVLTKGYSQK